MHRVTASYPSHEQARSMSEPATRIIEAQMPPGERDLDTLVSLNDRLFGFGETREHLQAFIRQHTQVLLLFAIRGEQTVGFKLGYPLDPQTFESWRGGVLPEARRAGIARRLVERQHAWCAAAGFTRIETMTNAENSPMLELNLAAGFRIVKTFRNPRGVRKVQLEKRIEAAVPQ